MKTLGIKPEDTGDKENTKQIIPATWEEDDDSSLIKAVFISVASHIVLPVVAWISFSILAFLLMLMGINLKLFDRPHPKMQDIEFVLVNTPEQTPLNKNTKYRADRNSRAGGKHDPTRKVSAPSPSASKPKQSSASQAPQPAVKPQPKSQPQPKQPQQQKPVQQQPKQVPPRLSPNPGMPKPRPSASPFKMPVPPVKNSSPQARPGAKDGSPSGSPLGAINPGSSKNRGTSGSAGRPASVGSGSGNSPYSLGSGNLGNPSPGNPNGRPGIDAIKEPDFGPYMRDLQDRIKRRWEPPRGNESKRVVLLFKIAKDGRLLKVTIVKGSGLPVADKAALDAVENAAPFKPLPPEFRGSDVEIQFTFDYNVFGATRY